MTKVTDITPDCEPIKLMREAVERCEAKTIRAGFVVLLTDDDHLWYDSCGKAKMEVLWAIEQAKLDLLAEDIGTRIDPVGILR